MTETLETTELMQLTPAQKKELDDLMASYNNLIMDDLIHHFNRRQKWSKRIQQLIVQYRVEPHVDKVKVSYFLTTHDKLIYKDWDWVLDNMEKKLDTKQIRSGLRKFMVQLMKCGLSTAIRKAKPLPEELI